MDFKHGSGEFLELGARTVSGSPALAAWIVGYGLVRTVVALFVPITGHLRLSAANIRGDWGWRPFLYTEIEICGKTYDISIYIYIRTNSPPTASVWGSLRLAPIIQYVKEVCI